MSKAFVRESDEEEDKPEESQALPIGFKNYMTLEDFRKGQVVVTSSCTGASRKLCGRSVVNWRASVHYRGHRLGHPSSIAHCQWVEFGSLRVPEGMLPGWLD